MELIKQIKHDIENGGKVSQEYSDYVIMTKLWRCPPSVFDEQDEYMINLHKTIFNLEKKNEYIQWKRQEQRSRNR